MEIKPYQSVGPIKFGQSKEECFGQLGSPKSIRINSDGMEELEYERIIVRIDPTINQVFECTLLPCTISTICETPITWDKRFLKIACELDGEPYDVFGFIVLRKLGIAVTGIHDDDVSQLAITVFKERAFDELLKSGVPYSPV